MDQPRLAQPSSEPVQELSASAEARLTRFKDYAVSHQLLSQVDLALTRAIREHAGFAHVLLYGPTGVGKTTMLRRIAKRVNGQIAPSFLPTRPPTHPHGSPARVPVLVVETRPPDGAAFNRADYYRTALSLLGEQFYEQRFLVDIHLERSWEKKGRGRGKVAQFEDVPELRHALEEALLRHGVQAVILDEAQHLMQTGLGASSRHLLDQLDWLKSMTNITGVLHILSGTYQLLDFRNLNGQAARRGLDMHFARYGLQHDQDRKEFQQVLLTLLAQVPLRTDTLALLQHWTYFYERSIGCVGVLKDWLVRATASALHDGSDTLTLSRLQEHALGLSQCESMALEATEGEQKLGYTESRREHLWRLLQLGMTPLPAPPPPSSTPALSSPAALPAERSEPPKEEATSSAVAPDPPKKTTRRSAREKEPTERASSPTREAEVPEEVAPKKRHTRKQAAATPEGSLSQMEPQASEESAVPTALAQPPPKKKQTRLVGQRKPQRDPVGKGQHTALVARDSTEEG